MTHPLRGNATFLDVREQARKLGASAPRNPRLMIPAVLQRSQREERGNVVSDRRSSLRIETRRCNTNINNIRMLQCFIRALWLMSRRHLGLGPASRAVPATSTSCLLRSEANRPIFRTRGRWRAGRRRRVRCLHVPMPTDAPALSRRVWRTPPASCQTRVAL
jgi:hypothetical protein